MELVSNLICLLKCLTIEQLIIERKKRIKDKSHHLNEGAFFAAHFVLALLERRALALASKLWPKWSGIGGRKSQCASA